MDFRTSVFFVGTLGILVSTALCLAGVLPIGGFFPFLRNRYVEFYKATFFIAAFLFLYRISYTIKKNRGNVAEEISKAAISNGFQMTMFSFMMAFMQRPMLLSLFPIASLAFYQWFTIMNKFVVTVEKKSWLAKIGFDRVFTHMQNNMHTVLALFCYP